MATSNPKVELSTMEVIPSRMALVNRKVLSPCRALCMGPRMERVPAQNNRMAVDSPWARLEPLDILETTRSKADARSSLVPISPPRARLTINNT